MFYLEKEFWICCSHRLHNSSFTDEENKMLFGKCNNFPCHGHNYKIILKLKSEKLNKATGMIVNFYDLKEVFNDLIDKKFDHMMLNNIDSFKDIIPTAENMCEVFYNILKPHIKELYAIKIYETEGACAEYGE